MPVLSSSGTLGKPLNIPRNRSDHHKGLYFLKNSTELLPHDWPYGCHPLVTFLHFLHMWAHKMYISPQKGMLISIGDNMVWGFAFHFSMSSSAHLRWLSIWSNHLIVSWLSCSYLRSFTSPLSYPHFEATHVLAALHVSQVTGGQNSFPRCFFRALVLHCSATCKADNYLSIVAQWGPHWYSFYV